MTLAGRILDLAGALRRAGVPVAVSDDLDALRAAPLVDLLDRGQLREALAATLVKAAAHRPVFDALFDVCFPASLGAVQVGARDVREFLADLVDRVRAGDDAGLRRLAAEAVGAYGGLAGRDGATGYYASRVFRQINLAGVLRRLRMEAGAGDALTDRLARDDFEQRLRLFRQEVEAEARRRLVLARGADQVAGTLTPALPEDADFLRLSREQEHELRRAVRPLARKLASRLAVKRRHATSERLDVRRTVRRSLATGGVPLEPAFRARRVSRPEVVLLCDVSGSVAAFARFSLAFCHALTGAFSRVRSFAFVDTVDEVTELFTGDVADAAARLAAKAEVVWLDGHSDYGHAFGVFATRYPDAVGPRTTLLVLGDARNNHRPSGAQALRGLTGRARRTHWLNPEPAKLWGTGDSLALDYAAVAGGMTECRNLRQLAAFVEAL
jgi:uncharacterized protein with von Willebrand factor type A (vWA) domain